MVGVFLVILSYAVSDESSIKALYQGFSGHAGALAGIVGRYEILPRSALSRILATWTTREVAAFRAVFEKEFALGLLPKALSGGLLDRPYAVLAGFATWEGEHHVC